MARSHSLHKTHSFSAWRHPSRKMDAEWIVRQNKIVQKEYAEVQNQLIETVARLRRYIRLPDHNTLLKVEDDIRANILENLRKMPETPRDHEYPPMTVKIVTHSGAWYNLRFPTDGLLSGPEWIELTKSIPNKFSTKLWQWIWDEINGMVANVWRKWIEEVLPDVKDIRVTTT